jgi:hypothetical protein
MTPKAWVEANGPCQDPPPRTTAFASVGSLAGTPASLPALPGNASGAEQVQRLREGPVRHGFHDATAARIKRPRERQPAANLAIACQRAGRPGRRPARPGGQRLRRQQPTPAGRPARSVSAIVATAGGGLHSYFTGSTQASGRPLRHHLDFKSRGGYVLAPPSQVNGKPYRLIARQPESAPSTGRRSPVSWTMSVQPVRPAQRNESPGRLSRAIARRQPQHRAVLGRMQDRGSRQARRPPPMRERSLPVRHGQLHSTLSFMPAVA